MVPTLPPSGQVHSRQLECDADWWAVRDLLVRTHASTPVAWNWDVRHWDGSRFHRERDLLALPGRAAVGLWEVSGRLVAAVHAEDGGDAFLELDPYFRDLEAEVIAWAEDHLGERLPDGSRRLQVYVWDYDRTRRALLEERGYTELDAGGWMRLARFAGAQAAPVALARPYELRTTSAASDAVDAQLVADLLNAAFQRTQHSAAEYSRFMSESPSFRHDLNLVAVARDGSFAAHVGVTYDEANRFGIFEPVCTHPDHRRRGLARAMIAEGMLRLQALGAQTACVETGDMEPANALYRACGFSEEYRGHWWQRVF
jgi:mycothiol synthase